MLVKRITQVYRDLSAQGQNGTDVVLVLEKAVPPTGDDGFLFLRLPGAISRKLLEQLSEVLEREEAEESVRPPLAASSFTETNEPGGSFLEADGTGSSFL